MLRVYGSAVKRWNNHDSLKIVPYLSILLRNFPCRISVTVAVAIAVTIAAVVAVAATVAVADTVAVAIAIAIFFH